jgi:hypothetical protein
VGACNRAGRDYSLRIKRLALISISCLLALLAPATAPAVSPLHSISVYGENEGGPPLAIFTTAKCVHKKGKSGKFFNAKLTSTDGESQMEVSIPEFGGFKKEYELEPGYDGDKPLVTVAIGEGEKAKGKHYFASYYPPPAPIPTIGRVLFREGGHLMGVGFGPAMYDYHGEQAINFTGVVECERPKKKGKA